MNQILPNIDLSNSRDFYGTYNTRDLYKGKSFNMAGEWKAGTHYFNDDSLQDFVSYEGVLLSCNKSHIATGQNIPELKYEIKDGVSVPVGVQNSTYWTFVLSGAPAKSRLYIPKYDEKTGELSWELGVDEVDIPSVNIKGNGITKIETKPSSNGKSQIVTFHYGNNSKQSIEIYNGEKGDIYVPSLSPLYLNEGYTWKLIFRNNNKASDTHSFTMDFTMLKNSLERSINDTAEVVINDRLDEIRNLVQFNISLYCVVPMNAAPKSPYTDEFTHWNIEKCKFEKDGTVYDLENNWRTDIPTMSSPYYNIYKSDTSFSGIPNEDKVSIENLQWSTPYIYIYGYKNPSIDLDGGEITL